MTSPITFQNVLDFWFSGEPLGEEQMNRWWKKNVSVDKDIRDRFAGLVDDVHRGLADEWAVTAEGRLAAITCLDQFPRNMYREDPRSFHYDERATALCREGLALEQHRSLPPLQQAFFVMPLMHSEQMPDQDECVRQFERLVGESTGAVQGYLSGSLDFAIKHRDIIARFQRFPHRNSILGRSSTAEELEFLTQPGSSF
ncbi:MAG: DUF924 family protein [Endozoicomonas sp.]